MRFPVFASVVMFCIWLAFQIRKRNKIDNAQQEAFWERERAANATRRKPLDDLAYITIPFDTLPMETLADNPEVVECHNTLREIAEGPIVNLTGISNTDLKLKYGAPNIDLLSLYDSRYTTLVRTLQKWSELLTKEGYDKEAITVLEFSISTGTDVSASYKLLAQLYVKSGQKEKISELIPIAEEINSPMSSFITDHLKGLLA